MAHLSLYEGNFQCKHKTLCFVFFFFSSFCFTNIHETHDCRVRGRISLTPHYHFYPFYRHLDISRAITAKSSPLHIPSSRTQTRNLCFPSASLQPPSYAPLSYAPISSHCQFLFRDISSLQYCLILMICCCTLLFFCLLFRSNLPQINKLMNFFGFFANSFARIQLTLTVILNH